MGSGSFWGRRDVIMVFVDDPWTGACDSQPGVLCILLSVVFT